MRTPELALVSAKNTATTYSFQTTGEGYRSWALCTVNDATGELNIQSDWGNWSHRWHTDALGSPTLTAFIGDRSGTDYLAGKLQQRDGGGRRWSARATARALCALLCARRLEDGRCQSEGRLDPDDMVDGKVPVRLRFNYTEDGIPVGRYRGSLPYLTRAAARSLWDGIEGVVDEVGDGEHDASLFYDRVIQIDGFTDYVTDEPWNHSQTEQTPEDKALRTIVLPALITACRARVEAPPPRSLSWTIQHVVAYLRAEAASFDDAVAMEEHKLSTHWAAVKQRAVQAMADRIEAGAWIPKTES